MTFFEMINAQYSTQQVMELLLRITLACFCGAAIGLERSSRLKEAGIRTHLVVCATAALLMIVSKYAFADLEVGAYGVRGADDARIAAQVVSGISFLCAGVIIKIGGNIKGLTTAACIWMTAAIGLAIGAGMYIVGIFTVWILIGLQFVLHHFPVGNDSRASNNVTIKVRESFSFEPEIRELMTETGGVLELVRMVYEEDGITYYFIIRTKKSISEELWLEFYKDHEDIIKLEHSTIA